MRKGWILCCLALGGCGLIRAEQAKTGLNAYIGRPLVEVALKFGPPMTSFDMGGGKMAFQWDHYGSGQTSGAATRIGGTVLYTAPQAYQTECKVSFVAVPARPGVAASDLPDWIVESWQYNGNGCI